MDDIKNNNSGALVELGIIDTFIDPMTEMFNLATKLSNAQYQYNQLKGQSNLSESQQQFIKQHEVEMKKFFEVYDKYTSLK